MGREMAESRIDSGRIMSQGFEALGRNFPAFLGVSLALSGVPSFAIQYWVMGEVMAGGSMPDSWALWWLGTLLASWVLAALLQGILVRESVLYLAGRSPDLGASIAAGLKLFLPIFVISLLVAVGMSIGLVLAIVPGIIVYIMMIAAVPALVEERRGILGSMRRSYQLTRGSYLAIFVLLVIYAMFAALVSAIFGLLFGVRNFGWDYADPLLSAIATGLVSTVTAMIGAVMIASLYIELRTVKEGASADDLATIFA